ncbi:polymorphic toxin type 43 domain-containing protein [Pseudomonas sp. ICMP 8385]|uniref:polymorphic toxin type 43 domain-containing protein n=1 Tax=Pseudomonas TaxID=286 RepID=UPI000C08226C|nr:hypothetical protein [Pseudomonas gessardii]
MFWLFGGNDSSEKFHCRVGAKATTSWQGSGPAPGVLGLEPGSASSKAIQNYFPSTKNGSIEFVFDPKTNTFAVGKPISNLGGSPHQQLAETIKSDGSTLVGGMFRRGPNGEVITNEFSGHYLQKRGQIYFSR